MKYLLVSLLLFTLFNCGGDNAAAEIAAQSEAYENMMDIHDRVMPRMGEIAQAQKGLQDAAEVAEAEDRKAALMKADATLEGAYDGMMVWMRQVKSLDELREDVEHTKILAYIKTEEEKMLKIEQQLDEGIQAAKNLLTD